MHTNHLGDSGMKCSPGISIAQGKIPEKENRVMLHNIFIFFGFHQKFNLVRGQFWHQVVPAHSRS
jgi:hypothetical protein